MDIKDIIQKNKEKKDPNAMLLRVVSDLQAKIDEDVRKAVEKLEEKMEDRVRQAVQEYGKTLKEVDLDDVMKSVKGQQGEVGEKGEKGDKGDRGDRGEQGAVGEQGVQGIQGEKGDMGPAGKDGYSPIPGIDFEIPKDGKDGKDGSPDTPMQIADKLNTLEQKVERKVIKGLEKWMEVMQINIQNATRLGGGGGMGNWITEAPSGSINGSNTSFTLTSRVGGAGRAIILLYNGQVQEYGNHFTVSGTTITMLFTPEEGTFLFAMYVRA